MIILRHLLFISFLLAALLPKVVGAVSGDDVDKRYDREHLQQIASHPIWRKLLHYNRFFPWSKVHGEVDGEGFYFASDGRQDPLSELKATLLAFQKNSKIGKLKQPARCAFPERFRFLKRELHLELPAPVAGECPDYESFIKQMDAQALDLVFSSAFSSNPGSMFGHTLFKFVKGDKSDLLDQGASFAATVNEEDGGLIYVIFGLMGGYHGDFSFQPYYKKVNEYINAESRDLWEYRLNLTPQEVRTVINHLWELESNSWFDYYFINKNCSYQLLTALEVAKPDWDLTSGWFFVVPAETIKRLMDVPNAVTQLRFRPSLRRKLESAFDLLTVEEKVVFEKLIRQEIVPNQVNSKNVISIAIQYVQYTRSEKGGKLEDRFLEFWKKLLSRRNALSHAPSLGSMNQASGLTMNSVTAYEPVPADHPEKGQGPLRIGLSQGFFQRGSSPSAGFQEFHIKPAYHDLLNDDRGYLPFSEFDFPNLTLRYYPVTGALHLERFQFLGMTTLLPMSLLEKRASWKIDLEIETPKDLSCGTYGTCLVFHSEMGWGASFNLFSPNHLLYGLAGTYVDLGSGLVRAYRLGPSAEIGFLSNPWKPYKLWVRSLIYLDAFQPFRPPAFGTFQVSQSFSWLPHWEARLIGLVTGNPEFLSGALPPYFEGKLSLNYYF